MSKTTVVHVHTEGYFTCTVIADNKEEAIEIGTGIWEEADFGELKEAEITSSESEKMNNREYFCTFEMEGYYECHIDCTPGDTHDRIILKAQNEEWPEADFGEMDDADVLYSEIVDEWGY